jgi:hypothetical protein
LLHEIGNTFFKTKYFSRNFKWRINAKHGSTDKVVMRTKKWTLQDGTLHKFHMGFAGSADNEYVMFLVDTVRRFRVLMQVMLKVDCNDTGDPLLLP